MCLQSLILCQVFEFLPYVDFHHKLSNVSTNKLHYQAGQLNEYTERKEMSADVVCMGLGPVPAGEQRCRFLAVGLSDDTVRIISLDPNVSIF